VAISARTERGRGISWMSQATFMADEQGVIDLTRHAPVGGDYAEVSAMGLIWAQQPLDSVSYDLFPDDVLVPLETTLTAKTATGVIAGGRLTQRFVASEIGRASCRERG